MAVSPFRCDGIRQKLQGVGFTRSPPAVKDLMISARKLDKKWFGVNECLSQNFKRKLLRASIKLHEGSLNGLDIRLLVIHRLRALFAISSTSLGYFNLSA
jgi:hypothetical protein